MVQRQILRGDTLDEAIDALLAQMISLGLENAPISCSGLMKPDTHLGENARQIEVSDDQATSFLFR